MAKKKYQFLFILTLSLLTLSISITPIFKGGILGVFHSIDPEVMYVSNALSYIKVHQIQYIDHPGTPSILTFAFLLTPFRLYAKYILHTPFIIFSLKNLDIIFYYLRICQAIILTISTFIFLNTISVFSKSTLTILFSWLALLSFSPFLFLGSSISPETLSFFIISIWLMVFAKYIKQKNALLIPTLSIISGLALANKFTNLFLVFASLILPLTLSKLSLRQKTTNTFVSIFSSLLGFILGTWAIRQHYSSLKNWFISLVTSTGIHAGGQKAIFNFPIHLESARSLLHQQPWPSRLIVLLLLIFLIRLSLKKIKIFSPVVLTTSVFLAGVLVFAKYPLAYYQLANYVVLAFILSTLVSKNKPILVGLCIILLFPSKANIANYLNTLSTAISKTVILENHINDHPTNLTTIWEWGRAKDFALLWSTSKSWHGNMFTPEMDILKPPLLELNQISENKLFDICWNKLYIQQVSAPAFLKKYSSYQLKYTPIPNTDNMAVIESDHCSDKKPKYISK